MKFTEFWDIYINEDITKHFPVFKEVFSQTLSENIFEEYDVRDIIFSFLNRYKTIKAFEQIEEFGQLLKAGNPVFYEEVSPFFHKVLVNYYCYNHKKDKLDWCIEDFVNNPLNDFDLLNKNMKELLFFQQTEAVEKIVDATFEAVSKADGYLPSASFDLALIKSHQVLEKVYTQYLETQSFPWEQFKTTLSGFGFSPTEEYINNVERTFRAAAWDIPEMLASWFEEDESTATEMLQKRFMMYMYDRGINFMVSGALWDHLYQYWELNNTGQPLGNYFHFEKEAFKTFVKRRAGFIMDYRFQCAAILWGCCYVYDFLLDITQVNPQEYQEIAKDLKVLRKELAQENLGDLWQYSFVHHWGKSNMDTTEEYEQEKALFDKYYNVSREQARKEEKNGFFASTAPTSWPKGTVKQKPVRSGKKIGRNEKVAVRYEDGTVKRNVKYKHVKLDIDKGRCEVI